MTQTDDDADYQNIRLKTTVKNRLDDAAPPYESLSYSDKVAWLLDQHENGSRSE